MMEDDVCVGVVTCKFCGKIIGLDTVVKDDVCETCKRAKNR